MIKNTQKLMLSSDGEILMHICPSGDHEEVMATCLMPSYAERFVDCWNALAGVEDPEKYIAKLREDYKILRDALEGMMRYFGDYPEFIPKPKPFSDYDTAQIVAREALNKTKNTENE